ncbi:MAG: tetratricopeptide repeat protein [Flavobacteriaceae bacterium]|nr:tetratricopeptide repeat protein [Flavobacteriaceae bacterium]
MRGFQNSVISLIYTILFLGGTTVIFSQTSNIDSLKVIIDTSARDSNKVNSLNELSIQILNNEDISQSLVYSKQASQLATEIGFKKGLAYAQKNIGLAEYYQGNYQFVLEHWTNSLETFEEIQDTLGIANMVNNLGAVYYSQGGYAKALDYYLRSLSISQKLEDTLRIATALVNIGGTYSDGVNDYEKALEYYDKLEVYLSRLNDNQITTAYLLGKGEIYQKRNELDKALDLYLEALPLNINDAYEKAHINGMLGKLYALKGEKSKAINYLNNAYNYASENNQKLQMTQSLLGLAEVYQEDDANKALEIYRKAEVIAQEIGTPNELRDIYKGMSAAYSNQGNYAKAYDFQSKHLTLKDSVFNLETNDKIRGLQFNFDLEKKEDEIDLLEKEAEIARERDKREKTFTYASVIAAGLILLLALGLLRRYRYIQRTNKIIANEKDRAESLLLNILPHETAMELQEHGKVKAKQFNSITVLFTDFIGFTRSSENLSPEELVKSVDFYFSKFDEIMEKHGLEKIKTIGDAYMCAAGLPFPKLDHSIIAVNAAFEMVQFVEQAKKRKDNIKHFDIRVGLNTGPVVAGVVGTKKFAYDIWGDTVNVASRMESKSERGRINVSENTYQLIKDHFECEYRGEIDVKNKGMMKMYFVNGLKKINITRKVIENTLKV